MATSRLGHLFRHRAAALRTPNTLLGLARRYGDAAGTKPPSVVRVFSEKDLVEFDSVFPDLVRELSTDPVYEAMPTANKRLSVCLQYNATKGKKNRGMTVYKTFKLLTPEESHTQENRTRAHVLGWCVEIFHASRYYIQGDPA